MVAEIGCNMLISIDGLTGETLTKKIAALISRTDIKIEDIPDMFLEIKMIRVRQGNNLLETTTYDVST